MPTDGIIRQVLQLWLRRYTLLVVAKSAGSTLGAKTPSCAFACLSTVGPAHLADAHALPLPPARTCILRILLHETRCAVLVPVEGADCIECKRDNATQKISNQFLNLGEHIVMVLLYHSRSCECFQDIRL